MFHLEGKSRLKILLFFLGLKHLIDSIFITSKAQNFELKQAREFYRTSSKELQASHVL